MQNYTSRMVSLMGALRKAMNGAVLDTFRLYGADYGMNYGVAIHTLRDMAREVGEDDGFARFLYRQQVRELRLIALWTASPAEVRSAEDVAFWASGIINSEVAEQAAQALLSRVESIDELLAAWCDGANELLAYTAMLAASRSAKVDVERAADAVVRSVRNFPNNHLAAQGAVALAVSLIKKNRPTVNLLLALSDDTPSAAYLREEVAWRLDY